MPDKLLTIIVPTFNRAASLELLLNTLLVELSGQEASVDVIIGDNVSTDRTPEVIQFFKSRYPSTLAYRHEKNGGFEENFCVCVGLVKTRYFWILGDDDLPKTGVVRQLVSLLSEESPSLLYMQSEWVDAIESSEQGALKRPLKWELQSREEFATNVHVWFTYISGLVVDNWRRMELQPNDEIRRYFGTKVVQLGWAFSLLNRGDKFIFITDGCVLSTKNNTGGYGLLTVFGVNYSRIVHEVFGRSSNLDKRLVSGNLKHYLPGLIWGARTAKGSRFEAESPWTALRQQLGDRWLYWLLVVPLGRFPIWLAQPFYQTWRVYSRIRRDLIKIRNARKYR